MPLRSWMSGPANIDERKEPSVAVGAAWKSRIDRQNMLTTTREIAERQARTPTTPVGTAATWTA